MVLTEVIGTYQGFFGNESEKSQMYNDIFETIRAADADLQPRMSAVFDELRRLNREVSKLVAEQDRRDLSRKQ